MDSVLNIFSYDELNRLDTANGSFGSLDYDYDINGNRIQLDNDGVVSVSSYEAASNRALQQAGSTVSLSPNGSMTRQGDRYYYYTPFSQLRQIRQYGQPLVDEYAYNGLGQRNSKKIAGKLTSYIYSTEGQLIAETSNGGATYKEYFYLNGQPVAMRDSELAESLTPSVILASTPATIGGSLEIKWSGISNPAYTDWVAIYEIGAPASEYLDWAYTGGNSSGSLTLPLNHPTLVAGNSYEIRLYPNDGYAPLLASSTQFVMNPTGPTVIMSSDTAVPGGTVDVAWSGIQSPTALDWVAIFEVGAPATEYLDWAYTGGASSGTLSLPLNHSSLVAGNSYEIRLYPNDGYSPLLADSRTFALLDSSTAAVNSKLYYIHNDHLGTPKVMTDEAGVVVWNATHDPFGKATVNEDVDGDGSAVELNVRFPGQYYDGESGLHYNYYRTYDPENGRYLTSDPIGLGGGLNTYQYVYNNPVGWIDLDGLIPIKPNGPEQNYNPKRPLPVEKWNPPETTSDKVARKVLDQLLKRVTDLGGLASKSPLALGISLSVRSKGLNESESEELEDLLNGTPSNACGPNYPTKR